MVWVGTDDERRSQVQRDPSGRIVAATRGDHGILEPAHRSAYHPGGEGGEVSTSGLDSLPGDAYIQGVRSPSWTQPLPCPRRGVPFGEPTFNPLGAIVRSAGGHPPTSGAHLNCGFSKASQTALRWRLFSTAHACFGKGGPPFFPGQTGYLLGKGLPPSHLPQAASTRHVPATRTPILRDRSVCRASRFLGSGNWSARPSRVEQIDTLGSFSRNVVPARPKD